MHRASATRRTTNRRWSAIDEPQSAALAIPLRNWEAGQWLSHRRSRQLIEHCAGTPQFGPDRARPLHLTKSTGVHLRAGRFGADRLHQRVERHHQDHLRRSNAGPSLLSVNRGEVELPALRRADRRHRATEPPSHRRVQSSVRRRRVDPHRRANRGPPQLRRTIEPDEGDFPAAVSTTNALPMPHARRVPRQTQCSPLGQRDIQRQRPNSPSRQDVNH